MTWIHEQNQKIIVQVDLETLLGSVKNLFHRTQYAALHPKVGCIP